MKKKLIICLFTAFIFSGINLSSAIETKNTDYEIIKETATNSYLNEALENSEIIKEDLNIKIIKKDDKYGIYDKTAKTFLFKPILDTIEPLSSNENEFKITIKDLKGYVNTQTKSNFLIKCDDIILADKYIKVKNAGKYGLLDKSGNTILQPVYKQLFVVNENGKEYFSAKYEGKHKLFYTTGKLIPDNELYSVSYDSHYLLAKDLKPEFINYKKKNSIQYDKAKYQDNFVYEIKEIQIPKNNTDKIISNKEKKELNTLIISKKEFIPVMNGYKIGLNTTDGKEVIPAKYVTISFKKPCKHFSKEILITNDGKYTTLYDLKGNIVAEETTDKINVYRNKKVYFYKKDGDNWNLFLNNKQIGNLELTYNGYKFSKTAFHLHNLHKINELLLAIISVKH